MRGRALRFSLDQNHRKVNEKKKEVQTTHVDFCGCLHSDNDVGRINSDDLRASGIHSPNAYRTDCAVLVALQVTARHMQGKSPCRVQFHMTHSDTSLVERRWGRSLPWQPRHLCTLLRINKFHFSAPSLQRFSTCIRENVNHLYQGNTTHNKPPAHIRVRIPHPVELTRQASSFCAGVLA